MRARSGRLFVIPTSVPTPETLPDRALDDKLLSFNAFRSTDEAPAARLHLQLARAMNDRPRRPARASVLRACALAVPALVLMSACSDRTVLAPVTPTPEVPSALSQVPVNCTVNREAGTVACAQASPQTAGISTALIGGQGTYVQVISNNVSYNAGTGIFQFDVRVANLLPQPMGSTDGATPDAEGVRLFFTSQPNVTGGTGVIEVANEDGSGSFTGSDQPYFQYDGVLEQNDTTPAKTWQLSVPSTVSTFSFTLFVSTRLSPSLVINEVMPNPTAVNDSVGEWFEVHNRGLETVNLNGWRLASNNDAVHTVTGSVPIPPRGYVVLGRVANAALNGGVTVAYAYGTGNGTTVTLNNTNSDWLALRTPSGASHDSVHWGGGTNVPTGASRALLAPQLDNTIVMGSNWGTSTASYGTGADLGTPGQPNDGTPAPSAGPPATVSVSPDPVSVAVGGTLQLTATARDADGVVTATTFTWASLNTAVATVSASGLVTGASAGQTVVVATAANGVADSVTVDVFTPTASGSVYRNHLEFGAPSPGGGANDIRLGKPEFALSYNTARGGPNWVSWNLNSTHFGGAERCDCFAADTALPVASRINSSDYTGSGYSRGHMVMSEQRTKTDPENARTFLMTNVLPQLQDLNGGPWLQFENHTNNLARFSAKEVYNIAGGIYPASPSFLNNAGRVAIPSHTWKIIVVMDFGEGLANVASAADIQVIAVNMPNQAGINGTSWTAYKVSVDAIEAATGFDFLSELPDAIEAAVEAAVN